MKILKVVCHLGVDSMLKSALGSRLTMWRPLITTESGERRHRDAGWWIVPDFDFVEEIDPQEHWDIIIVDESATNELTKSLRSQSRVWYVHGSYHVDTNYAYGQRHYFNKSFANFHVLSTDRSRWGIVSEWYQHTPPSHLILPIHPQSKYYVPIARQRNGRCYVMGHNFMEKCALYGNMDVVNEVMAGLTNTNRFDYFGYNDDFPDFNRGAGTARSLSSYSVSVHPSFVQTMGFVLMESLCAGVPVITTPKVDLPESLSGSHYVIARTTREFLDWTKKLLENKELAIQMGKRAQVFMRNKFSFAQYRHKLRTWMQDIIRRG